MALGAFSPAILLDRRLATIDLTDQEVTMERGSGGIHLLSWQRPVTGRAILTTSAPTPTMTM
ncbi:MAG: hypothetical protein VCA38_03660 [Roseibacillus sp.]